ncbi:hypothetical protein [cf. Phormidesmis sp. LEGE 11477]|nr:hypothetical protein [cf. Phormidesmis sp. LEGE 11477]MBE9062850.1 hypothetical protein [cf. Phormidesmis sp. LEGE 11477]
MNYTDFEERSAVRKTERLRVSDQAITDLSAGDQLLFERFGQAGERTLH